MSEITGARELIGLHTNEADDGLGETPALGTADALYRDFVDGFIEQVNLDVPGVAQALLPDQIFGEPGKTRERVARKNAAKMAHHIAVIIILGRLDEIEVKSFAHFTGQSRDQIRGWERSRAQAVMLSYRLRCSKPIPGLLRIPSNGRPRERPAARSGGLTAGGEEASGSVEIDVRQKQAFLPIGLIAE